MDQEQRAQELVERYADFILRLSYAYLKNTHDAQDICQDVLLKLLTERPDLRAGSMSGPGSRGLPPTPARIC